MITPETLQRMKDEKAALEADRAKPTEAPKTQSAESRTHDRGYLWATTEADYGTLEYLESIGQGGDTNLFIQLGDYFKTWTDAPHHRRAFYNGAMKAWKELQVAMGEEATA
jgi:hypothetical protein